MSDELRAQMSVIVVVTIAGVLAVVIALTQMHANVDAMGPHALSTAVFLVPCAVMVLCSFLIMLTANAIGRQLFVCVVALCVVFGAFATVATSGWFVGTEVTPPLSNTVALIRNFAAYIVCPTVGSIAGAWLGSRIHPMSATKARRKKCR